VYVFKGGQRVEGGGLAGGCENSEPLLLEGLGEGKADAGAATGYEDGLGHVRDQNRVKVRDTEEVKRDIPIEGGPQGAL
jgi:hypothetical protein